MLVCVCVAYVAEGLSYMMGRRLVRKDAGRDGAMHALRGKLRDQLPVKKRTCPEPDAEPVHTGYTYDEVMDDSSAPFPLRCIQDVCPHVVQRLLSLHGMI